MKVGWKLELDQTLRLAWPIVLGNLTHLLMAFIDSVMVGRLGVLPLAGASLGGAILGFTIITSLGISSAIGPLVARQKGALNYEGCSKVLQHGLCVALIAGSFFSLIILFIAKNLSQLGQPQEVVPLAQDYLYILAPSLIFVMLFSALRVFSEGLGNPKPIAAFLVATLALNVFFNWVLIFGNLGAPAMGLSGAALGTLIARILSLAAVSIYIFKAKFYKRFLFSWKPLEKSYFVSHLKLGIPGSLQYACEAGAFSGAAILMGLIGPIALAAHQIAINLASMTFMLALGTSVATSIRVGEAHGNNNLPQARLAGFTGIALACFCMTIFAFVFYFARYWLPTLYISDSQVINVAAPLLIVAAFFQFFDGAQGVASGALRGLLDVKIPVIVTFFSYWVFAIPLAYYLGVHTSLASIGVWIGLLAGLGVASLALCLRFHLLTRAPN
ncbi:MATE family efflux transporter [bacterium]|nr:MATE family efflux transporter [bacterium]